MNNAVISELHPNSKSCEPDMLCWHERILVMVHRALKALGRKGAEARRARRTFEQLTAMSDHELWDIGIIRFDIPTIVAGTFRDMRPATSNVILLERRIRLRSPDVAEKSSAA